MSCECDYACCYGMLSASESGTPPIRELYRRPARRRHPRHVSRRRLLLQHMSCPNNFGKSDELSTTSADEMGAWASRRTHSDLPARRYKTSRAGVRLSRACLLPTSRRTASRSHRPTTVVHHPCCLFDPRLCPMMKGSHHREMPRPEDIDSETIRTTEELRSQIETFLHQHERIKTQKAPCHPEAERQTPASRPQHPRKQTKPVQPSDVRGKKCEICGSSQHVIDFADTYLGQPSAPTAEQSFVPADTLAQNLSSDTVDRMLDDLNRRSARPRVAQTHQRGKFGDIIEQQRTFASENVTDHLPAPLMTAGSRKEEAVSKTTTQLADAASGMPPQDIRCSHVSHQNMPRPRSTADCQFLEEYFLRHPSLILEKGNEMGTTPAQKSGPRATQLDLGASYTMHSIAAARAANTKLSDITNPRRHASSGNYAHEEVGIRPTNVTRISTQETRRAASEGGAPSGNVMSPAPPNNGVAAFESQIVGSTNDHAGCVEPEIGIMTQSEPDSARFTAGTYESGASGLHQTVKDAAAAGTASSNGDFQSGRQTPAECERGTHLMDDVVNAVNNWHASGSDMAQRNWTDKPLSSAPSVCQEAATGDVSELHRSHRASSQGSPSPRKSITSPISHGSAGNYREATARKPVNVSPKNINLAASDDSAVYSRHSCMDSLNKPEEADDTSVCSDKAGSCTYRSKDGKAHGGHDKQQGAAKSASHVCTPVAGSSCKSKEKVINNSRAESLCGSSATASTKKLRRRVQDRGGGDAASHTDDAKGVAPQTSRLTVKEQVEASQKKIITSIDNALLVLGHIPAGEPNNNDSPPKVHSSPKLTARRESPRAEYSVLSSELWYHVNKTVKEVLSSLPKHRTDASSTEEHSNKKLLLKLQRDLTKTILTNLKRLDDIESLLHPANGMEPSAPPSN